MKTVLLVLATALFNFKANAIALNCQLGEVHLFNAAVMTDITGQCPSGQRIQINPQQSPCLETTESIQPGLYQVCGTYTQQTDTFTIRVGVDARLR